MHHKTGQWPIAFVAPQYTKGQVVGAELEMISTVEDRQVCQRKLVEK